MSPALILQYLLDALPVDVPETRTLVTMPGRRRELDKFYQGIQGVTKSRASFMR
jgi:hypothetical protein